MEKYQRERQEAWDLENMASASTRMLAWQYQAFRDLAAAERTTVYAVLRSAAYAWMAEAAGRHPEVVESLGCH